MPKRIQRKRSKGWRMPEGAIYVGRPSKWGNPFTVEGGWIVWVAVALGFLGNLVGRREAVVALHRLWLTGNLTQRPIRKGGSMIFENPRTSETYEVEADEHVRNLASRFSGIYESPELPERPSLSELRGKDLVCWCPLDEPCHADVLLELANSVAE